MKEGGDNSSLVVIGSFIFLFLVFVFLNQPKPTGYVPFIGDTGEISVISLVIVVIILVVILAAAFIIYKKIKQKKLTGKEPPIPKGKKGKANIPKPLADLDKEVTKDSGKRKDEKELSEDEIENLFKEPIKVEKKQVEAKVEKPKEEKKPEINLTELKNTILGLMNQNFTKDQIVSYLKGKGLDLENIVKVINQINSENLQRYINATLKMGFTKEQIISALKSRGWPLQEIQKFI